MSYDTNQDKLLFDVEEDWNGSCVWLRLRKGLMGGMLGKPLLED
jgi:hypothetical protein